jgi:alkylation response protein AidB-like acyl-CoA dehydrogenase
MTYKDFSTVKNTAAEIAQTVLKSNSQRIDANAEWPRESIEALLKAGLGGLVVDRKYGGLGYGQSGLAVICEILAGSCASTALCFGMHCVASAMISARATKYQVENYLKPIVAGTHLTTLALSEPSSGAHFYIPETKLFSNNSPDYMLEGEKTFITNGSYADSYIVSTVTGEEEAPMGEFSCVIVPGNKEGLIWGEVWKGFGMRGNSSRSLKLDKVKISKDDLLGEEGAQIWFIFNIVAPYFLTAMAGTYLGIASAAFKDAKEHVAKRSHSATGTDLKSLSFLQHKIGVLYARLESVRRLLYYAAQQSDSSQPDSDVLIFSAKAEVADAAVFICNEALTIAGGIGYRENSNFSRYLRDVRASHVMAPTTDVLRIWAGRALLDQPLLGE